MMTAGVPSSGSHLPQATAEQEVASPRRGREPLLRRQLDWRGEQLFLGHLYVGEVMLWRSPPHSGQWRAWVMTEAAGTHHGWFATEPEARRHAEAIVAAALGESR